MYTLYISRDKSRPERFDVGSILCLNLFEALPEGSVVVRECTKEDRPSNVHGTPTLISDSAYFTGHEALQHITQMALGEAERRGRVSVPKETETSKRVRRSVPPPATVQRLQQTRSGEENGPPMHPSLDASEDDGSTMMLWESRISEDDTEGDTVSNGKITTEDLARAVQAREQTPRGTAVQPPPPPVQED